VAFSSSCYATLRARGGGEGGRTAKLDKVWAAIPQHALVGNRNTWERACVTHCTQVEQARQGFVDGVRGMGCISSTTTTVGRWPSPFENTRTPFHRLLPRGAELRAAGEVCPQPLPLQTPRWPATPRPRANATTKARGGTRTGKGGGKRTQTIQHRWEHTHRRPTDNRKLLNGLRWLHHYSRVRTAEAAVGGRADRHASGRAVP
jgi:hypothetical protein